MANADSSYTLTVDEMLYRMYDAQALIKCVMEVLDEDQQDDKIRVLRQALAITNEIALTLDEMSLPAPAASANAEQTHTGQAAQH